MKSLFRFYSETDPEEVCGFVLENKRSVQVKNVHPEPTQGFEIDPEDIMSYIDRIKGIWHTHPQATSVLSGEDKQCIEQWPDVAHYIVGEDGIRKYVVENGVVVDADYIPR